MSYIKQFIAYPAFITWLKSLFIFYRHNKVFVKMFFLINFLEYLYSSRIALVNLFTRFFPLIRTAFLTKFIVNTNNFVRKIVRNMCLIFLSVSSIIFSLLLTLFRIHSKSAWVLNGTANYLIWFFISLYHFLILHFAYYLFFKKFLHPIKTLSLVLKKAISEKVFF